MYDTVQTQKRAARKVHAPYTPKAASDRSGVPSGVLGTYSPQAANATEGKTAYVGVTMSTMNATAESTSWLLTREQTEPEVRFDEAARIARAIAQLMDPEWREFVDEEQREKRRIASSSRSEA